MFKKILTHLSIALTLFAFLPQTGHSQSAEKTILVMGDSLSAGYRLPHGSSFPSKLEVWFQASEQNIKVINAGVSGDTSAGGLARLDWALAGLAQKPDLVIVEFGGNDALRGIDPENTRANLSQILIELNDQNIPAYLMGMQAPPNMGADYGNEFNGIYAELAARHKVALYPFFLDGVAAIPELNLDDGMHPNEAGIDIIVERIAPLVLGLIN